MSDTSTNNVTQDNKSSKINKVKISILICVLAVFLLGAVVISYSANYSKVYPNTYINEISVGGMDLAELSSFCENFAEENSVPATLRFKLNGEQLTVSAKDIGLEFDFEKTATAVFGSREKNGFMANAVAYMKSIFNESNFTASVKYDSQKLDKIITEFASEYETEPRDASYFFEDGKLIIKKGIDGKKVDKTALISEIEKRISEKSPEIPLVLTKAEGKVFDADELFKELSAPAKDAYYEKNNDGEIIIIPDKPQITVDKSELKSAIKSGKDTVSLPAEIVPAKKTRDDLEKALFSGTMGSWTSNFSASNVPRTENVRLSASRVNNTILMPGESFSYDKTVGPRTAKNGFKVAGVYINNKVEDGIGGGVCQTSSTLYSAVLYANLEIVSRTSHSLPVSYMPPGQDATIAEGYIDFIFKNNTQYPIKITATLSGGSITCSIIGTPVKGQKVVINNTKTATYEPKTEIETDASIPKGYKKTTKGSGGYAVSSSRTVYMNGQVVKTEPLTKSVYHATPHIITVNPEDKDTPPETLIEEGTVSASSTPEEIELNGTDTESEKTTPATSEEEIVIEI